MNPIELAISPLKEISMNRASEVMEKRIEEVLTRLKEFNWDVKAAYPRPSGTDEKLVYRQKLAAHNFAISITEEDPTKKRLSFSDPFFVKKSPRKIAVVLDNAKALAALQYEAYSTKLNFKIGEVVAAELLDVGNIWNYSVLKIVKENSEVEHWKTQCIVNVSSLGKLFNQWPTRKMK